MTEITIPTTPLTTSSYEIQAFAGDAHVRNLIIRGCVVAAVFFVVLGGWAAVARLDSAAVAPGVVQSENSRKIVQHPDGGVVTAVLVKDGDLVRQGQELIQLDPVQAKAAADIETAEADGLAATVARLQAEQIGADHITFPAGLMARASSSSVAQAMAAQIRLFQARQSDLSGAGGALDQQVAQANSQAVGYTSQIQAARQQYSLIEEELSGVKQLYDKGFATKPRLLALQRAAAALVGQTDEYKADVERLRFSAAQTQQQIAQLRRDRLSSVSDELGQAQAKLADAFERQAAAKAVLDHTVVRAPVDGHVLGLAANVGTVIGRGEPLLQIIPTDGSLVVDARLKPADGAHVKKGMKVDLRVSSTEGRSLPKLRGVVDSRSADLMADAKSETPYYTIKVRVIPEDAERVKDAGLGVGTPMQVIVPTGSRTALEYMFQPVADSFRRGLKER